MATLGGGKAAYVLQTTDAAAAVEHFARRINTPVLTNVKVEFRGVRVSETFPPLNALPDLYDVEPLVMHGRVARLSEPEQVAAPSSARIIVTGMSGDGPWRKEIPFPNLPENRAGVRTPFMLRARDVHLRLGYLDLWRASRGAPLRIASLRASQLDVRIERRADGRASWQFGKPVDAATKSSARVPEFDQLQVDQGTLQLHDAPLELDLDARFSLREGLGAGAGPGAASGPLATPTASASAASGVAAAESPALAAGLQFHARGHYRKRPLKVDLSSVGVSSAVGAGAAQIALPVTLNLSTDRARLVFNGTATGVLRLSALQGRISIKGPSLAAFGDPFGVTLPTTGPFDLEGGLAKHGAVWSTVIDTATVGGSRLNAALTFDTSRPVPLLAGRLGGANLVLADLGPAIGTTALRADHEGVLPDRPLDIPSLRAMDANVVVAIDSVDLGTSLLQPLRPLHAHLVLAGGVLTLRDVDARTSQGRLVGTVRLDGREAQAVWNADLRWSGVRLEQWIHQVRAQGAPPYVSGSLSGRARVEGKGRSTAAILGSLDGGVRVDLAGATISHLAVEAAGLDLAQALGVMIKGDDALPIRCATADLVASKGVLRPRVMVLDTPDSTLWIDGSLSLASEALDLRVIVMPKDFSPLALRAPIRVRGSLSDPTVSIQKDALGARVGAAALLALINPLAALIPLIDTGATAEADRAAADCRALATRASPNAARGRPPGAVPAKPAVDAAAQARRAAPPGTPR